MVLTHLDPALVLALRAIACDGALDLEAILEIDEPRRLAARCAPSVRGTR